MVANYHFGYSHGKSSFKFDFINNDSFGECLKKIKETEENKETITLEELWKLTEEIIKNLHKLISEHLFCDDYRFLSRTESLYPIIQLFIQYPQLVDKIKDDKNNEENIPEKLETKILCRLILQFQLASYSTKDLLNIVYSIYHSRDNLRETINKIDEERLEKITGKKEKPIFEPESKQENKIKWEFGEGSDWDDVNSVNHRYVHLMYWLQRKLGAKDFNYKNNIEEYRYSKFEEKFINRNNGGENGEGKPTEVEINKSVQPQREHLIPYSILKDILDIKDGKRISNHPANNIGNLTFISGLFNSMDYGKSNNIMKIDEEYENNLNAHFLNGDFLKENSLKEISESKCDYEKFIKNRRNLIKEEFQNWINNLNVEPYDIPKTNYEIQHYTDRYLELKNQFDDDFAELIWRTHHNCKTGNPTEGFTYHTKLRPVKNRYLILYKKKPKTEKIKSTHKNNNINFCLYKDDKSICIEYYDNNNENKTIYENNTVKIKKILNELNKKEFKDINNEDVHKELIDSINENIDETENKIPILEESK